MPRKPKPLNTVKEFKISATKKGKFHSLPALQKTLGVSIDRLPISIRIVLESVLRNCDGKKVTDPTLLRTLKANLEEACMIPG